MRIGYFDADGKCVAIATGGDYSGSYSYSAPVPANLGPNTAAFADGQVIEIAPPPLPEPPLPAGKTLIERVTELEAEVTKLKEKLP